MEPCISATKILQPSSSLIQDCRLVDLISGASWRTVRKSHTLQVVWWLYHGIMQSALMTTHQMKLRRHLPPPLPVLWTSVLHDIYLEDYRSKLSIRVGRFWCNRLKRSQSCYPWTKSKMSKDWKRVLSQVYEVWVQLPITECQTMIKSVIVMLSVYYCTSHYSCINKD